MDNLEAFITDILSEEPFRRNILPALDSYANRPFGERVKSLFRGTSYIDDAIFLWLQEESDELDFQWPQKLVDAIYAYGREKFPHALSRARGNKEQASRKVIQAINRIHRNYLAQKRREKEEEELSILPQYDTFTTRRKSADNSEQKPEKEKRVKWNTDQYSDKPEKEKKPKDPIIADPRYYLSNEDYIQDVISNWMQEKSDELDFQWPDKLKINIEEYAQSKFENAIARSNGNRKEAARKIVSAVSRLYRSYISKKRTEREERIERLAGIYRP